VTSDSGCIDAEGRIEYLEDLLDQVLVALAESVGLWVAPPHELIGLPSRDSDRARQIMNVLGARPCYICNTYVLTREEGWWNDKGQAWCHAHQPVWSR
jgi:hypothetical protein